MSSPDGSVTAPITSGHAERAWGWDYTWRPMATVLTIGVTVAEDPINGVGGDGGGFSLDEPQPSYQRRRARHPNAFTAVPYFTSTNVQDIGRRGVRSAHRL